jgi:hypothetical protein
MGNLGVGGKMILKRILKKLVVRFCIEFNWLRIRHNGELM